MGTITASDLGTVQKTLTAARRALGLPVALQINESIIQPARNALGALAKTFDKSDILEILPSVDSLRINWASGYMILKDIANPAKPATPLDFAEIVQSDKPVEIIAAQLLGSDTVTDALYTRALAKIDKTWDECTTRADALYTLAHGGTPKHMRYISNPLERAAAIFKTAGKLQKGMRAYEKIGGDYSVEVRALLERARYDQGKAERDIPGNVEELEEKQREYMELFKTGDGLPSPIMSALDSVTVADAAWLASLGTAEREEKDALFADYVEKKETARLAFINWCGVDPDYDYYNAPHEAATISVDLAAARSAADHYKATSERVELLKRLVYGVDNLGLALSRPQDLKGE